MKRMAVKRAAAAGVLAAAMAAAVVLLSAPSAIRASALGLLREHGVALDLATYPLHLTSVHPKLPRRSTPPDDASPVVAVQLALVLLGVAIAVTPRAIPVVRRSRPAVRGPPSRAV
jgi:hypothetical protein